MCTSLPPLSSLSLQLNVDDLQSTITYMHDNKKYKRVRGNILSLCNRIVFSDWHCSYYMLRNIRMNDVL